ncbi:MAG: restriction endonuclease subunit S [Acidimicrobiales bacterium]
MSGTAISELCEINPKHPTDVPADELVAFVGMAELDDVTAIASDVELRPFGDVSKGYTPLKAGDILMAKITPCFENCKIGQARTSTEVAAGSTEFHVMRPDTSRLDDRYLLHFLRRPEVLELGELRMTGSGGQRRVPKRFLDELQVPLPPIEEQRRIAAVLDAADALRTKRRQALAKLDTLTQAIFIDMFGDPVVNSAKRDRYKISDLCRLVRGSSPRPKGDPRFYGGVVPRLMIADISRDGFLVTPRIDSLTEAGAKLSRPVEAGTVVMTVSGNVGVVAKLAVDACVHDGFVAFTEVSEQMIRPDFLMYQLDLSRSIHVQNTAGAIFQNLTTKDIKALPIVVPALELQDTYLSRVDAVASQRAALAGSASSLDALFGSLQQRAFRGEL